MTDQMAYVQDKRLELEHLQQRLGDLAGAGAARKQKTFTALAASLDAMSPLTVLGRGYAVARNEEGKVLKSCAGDASGRAGITSRWERAASPPWWTSPIRGGTAMSAKKQTFEQEIARLEEIVAALEKGDAPLADSLALFEEGTKLIAACSQELDAAEQKVVKLMKGPDGAPVELPFGEEEQG